MNKTVGTCSICGGRVSVPYVWHGITPPIPTCECCGATQKQPYGPVIPMEPTSPKFPRTPWGDPYQLSRVIHGMTKCGFFTT